MKNAYKLILVLLMLANASYAQNLQEFVQNKINRIFQKKLFDKNDAKEFRIRLSAAMGATSAGQQQQIEFQNLLTVATMAQVTHSKFKNELQLNKFWKQASESRSSNEIQVAEIRVLRQIENLSDSTQFLDNLEKYRSFLAGSQNAAGLYEFQIYLCSQYSEIRSLIKLENCIQQLLALPNISQNQISRSRFIQASFYLSNGYPEKAAPIVSEIPDVVDPTDPNLGLQLHRVRLMIYQKKWDPALVLLTKIFDAQERNKDARLAIGIHAFRAQIFLFQNKLSDAEVEVAGARQVKTDSIVEQSFGYKYINFLASILEYKKGNIEAAENLADQANESIKTLNHTYQTQTQLLRLLLKRISKRPLDTASPKQFFKSSDVKNRKYQTADIVRSFTQLGIVLSKDNFSEKDLVEIEKIEKDIRKFVPEFDPILFLTNELISKMKASSAVANFKPGHH